MAELIRMESESAAVPPPAAAGGRAGLSFLGPLLQRWLTWYGVPLLLFMLVAPPLPLFGKAYAGVHTVLEVSAVVVACLVFAVAWSMYPRTRQAVLLLAGCGFLGVALLDLFHLLSYPGMPDWITPNGSNDKSIALWLAARELAALILLGLLAWPRPAPASTLRRALPLGATLLVSVTLGVAIVFWAQAHPGVFFGAAGLTPLKLALEYLIVATTGAALFMLVRRPPSADFPVDGKQLAMALLTMMTGEILFTLYRGPTDLFNFAGHIYKAIAYYQLYRALYIGMVREPFRRMEAAEAALRQGEANLAALFEASPDGILVVDPAGMVAHANPQAAAMFGYASGELDGLPHSQLLPAAQRASHDALVNDYFAGNQPRLMGQGRRFSALRRDGTQFPVEVGLSPVSQGGVTHVIATVRDVSARDQLECQLEASESRLRDFLDNAVDWVWEVDGAGLYSYSSRSVEALLGYRPEEVIGQSPLDFMPFDEAQRVGQVWRELLQRQVPLVQLENVNRHRDGHLATLETSGVPFHDAAGNFLGYRGIARDVTRRNAARQALQQSEQRFRLAFDHSPIGMGIADPQGYILHVNATLAQMLGYTAAELARLKVTDLAHPADYAASLPWRQAMLAGRIPVATFEIRYRHRDGHYVWTQASIVAAGAPGQPEYLLAQIQDYSDERESRLRNTRLLAIIERTGVAIGTLTPDGHVTYLNPAARQLLGIAADEALGQWRGIDFHPPEAAAQIAERAIPLAQRTGIWEGETLWRSREGEDIPVWQTIMVHRNAQGEVDYWSTIARDLREVRRWKETVAFQDSHDMLTALPNRYLLRDRLQQAMANARRADRLVAVMVIDIDHFKRINDSLGHTSGDAILLALAQRLRAALRESDTLARQGGDEFIVLLSDVGLVQDIVGIAEKLNASFDAPIQLQQRDLFVTASIGLSVFPFDEDNPDELLRKAEVAMYRAKELGRNTYQFYTGEMDQRYREDLEVEADLRQAIERGELALHYQPKFCLADDHLAGFEALLRWHHPVHGLIPPGRFIPVAERSNLIAALGEWALTTACRQWVRWQEEGLAPGHVAVNVSAQQFEYSDVAGMVRRVLGETGLEPRCLELEITESILMRDPVVASRLLEDLKSLRIKIAIDDFGTGYSSLSYLKRFPVDVLKIDRAFVQEVTSNEDDAAIVRAVVSMAHALGIGVVAEGIETPEQQAFLRACGCDLAQGFLLGRPGDAAASRALLAQAARHDGAAA